MVVRFRKPGVTFVADYSRTVGTVSGPFSRVLRIPQALLGLSVSRFAGEHLLVCGDSALVSALAAVTFRQLELLRHLARDRRNRDLLLPAWNQFAEAYPGRPPQP